VVAAADLAAGQVLQPGDLALSRYPADQVPVGSYARPEQVLGRALAGAVRRAEPLTDVRIVGAAALTGSVGLVEVAVRLADAGAAQLVRPGDTVDVLAATPDQASPGYGDPTADVRPIPTSGGPPMAAVVASSVRVLAGPGPPDVGSVGSGGSDGALVVLAVTPATARVLAAAAAYARLSVLIRSGATGR
jgi:Flp pilus assembly protein CpaB